MSNKPRNPFGVVGDAAEGQYAPVQPKPRAPSTRTVATKPTAAQLQARVQRRANAIKASDSVQARRVVKNARRFPNRPASDPWANEAVFKRAVSDARVGR